MTLKLRAKLDGWWVFRDALMFTPEEFTTPTGNLWGINRTPFNTARLMTAHAGELPEHYRDSFWNHAVYAVYSYATPIAWRLENGKWICPDIKYSRTTSAHQSKIFTALSQIGA